MNFKLFGFTAGQVLEFYHKTGISSDQLEVHIGLPDEGEPGPDDLWFVSSRIHEEYRCVDYCHTVSWVPEGGTPPPSDAPYLAILKEKDAETMGYWDFFSALGECSWVLSIWYITWPGNKHRWIPPEDFRMEGEWPFLGDVETPLYRHVVATGCPVCSRFINEVIAPRILRD